MCVCVYVCMYDVFINFGIYIYMFIYKFTMKVHINVPLHYTHTHVFIYGYLGLHIRTHTQTHQKMDAKAQELASASSREAVLCCKLAQAVQHHQVLLHQSQDEGVHTWDIFIFRHVHKLMCVLLTAMRHKWSYAKDVQTRENDRMHF